MPFLQPPVPQLPSGIDLTGQTGIVTGATSGLGLAIARQLLLLNLSTLVLAVRDPAKGEQVKKSLLSDTLVKARKPAAAIQVMVLDTASYTNVIEFATAFKQRYDELYLLMLNTGGISQERKVTSSGHEQAIQVNYLSNIMLQEQLLPLMEATATKNGKTTRITWTGSRAYKRTSLLQRPLPQNAISLMKHFDDGESVPLFTRYADSKLLGFLYLQEMASHYNPERVVINSFCPNTVKSGMAREMPISYARLDLSSVKLEYY